MVPGGVQRPLVDQKPRTTNADLVKKINERASSVRRERTAIRAAGPLRPVPVFHPWIGGGGAAPDGGGTTSSSSSMAAELEEEWVLIEQNDLGFIPVEGHVPASPRQQVVVDVHLPHEHAPKNTIRSWGRSGWEHRPQLRMVFFGAGVCH